LRDDVWELYNVNEDFSQANNLAASNPEKLKELQALFVAEATRNRVFPIDDRRAERFNAAIAGRPDLMGTRTSLTLFDGMTGIAENAFINIKNRSYTIEADVELSNAKTNGVIISQAGRFGGWALYMKDGKPRHEYNFFGIEKTNIGASKPLAAGKHLIKYEFIADSPKPATGGICNLYVDGQKVAEGRIPQTQPFSFSGDEGVDVGIDNETNVSNDYRERHNKFTGMIRKVTVDIAPGKK
jgi:arylsulfatase